MTNTQKNTYRELLMQFKNATSSNIDSAYNRLQSYTKDMIVRGFTDELDKIHSEIFISIN